ncbi:MAG: helix-turn-helix transcriptional regulator [Clostridia bacterium]|nr:helix-turn-helix transcriptional regulator [Clostridia bacterium]
MKNTVQGIGERIRFERLRANLTQAELAGNDITRNMLSMIERAEASPSVETLVLIANKLGVPAGVFFSDSAETDALYEKAGAVSKAKALFESGRYDECADTCRSIPYDDELNMLLSESLLKIAEENAEKYMFESAIRSLNAARATAKSCRYSDASFFGTLDSYEKFISFTVNGIDIDSLSNISSAPSRIPAGEYVFLALLYHLDRGEPDVAQSVASSLPFMRKEYMKYLKAKKYALEFKFAKALEILVPLYESKGLGFIAKYRVISDIETCYESKRDFESAYKYSSIKHHILECFSK